MALPIHCQSNKPDPTKELLLIDHKIAKLGDQIAKSSRKAEKAIARAHYVMGEIILGDQNLLALVAPHLGPHLAKLGSARVTVDEYQANVAKLTHLKNSWRVLRETEDRSSRS